MFKGLLSSRMPCLLFGGVRGMSTTVDKMALSKLRKRTGISFINCKKALQQFDNDLEKAEKWLKEQAQKEGWTKATKLQSRSMSNGLVAIISDKEGATMIEVNCETDFVARNNKFINLTTSLAQECHQALLRQSEPLLVLDKAIGSLGASNGKSLADLVALEVGSIGENMALRRAVHFKESNSVLSSYVHASGPEITTDSDCYLGKYGVLLSLTQQPLSEKNESLPVREVANFLGQHIVGMNPKQVGTLEDLEKKAAKAKEAAKAREAAKAKEAAAKDKESEGESEDEFEEMFPGDMQEEEDEEEDKLLVQQFLLDSSVRVGELLKDNGLTVNAFYRFACGEELPQDEKD